MRRLLQEDLSTIRLQLIELIESFEFKESGANVSKVELGESGKRGLGKGEKGTDLFLAFVPCPVLNKVYTF